MNHAVEHEVRPAKGGRPAAAHRRTPATLQPDAPANSPEKIRGATAGLPLFLAGRTVQRRPADGVAVNEPGDVYEQEAEAQADLVVQRLSRSTAPPSPGTASLQRQPIEEEEELVQRQPIEEEEELVQRQPLEEEKEFVQRQPIEEEEETVQRRAGPGSAPPAGAGLGTALAGARGAGHPLPDGLRARMEAGFGADFSGVRIHTDRRAAGMAGRLQAQAFTVGQDIFFNAGRFKPGSAEGEHLVAHELTHTLQQGGPRRKPDLTPAPSMIQRFLDIDIRGDVARFAHDNVPGYTLITVIAAYDPITGRGVVRTRDTLLQGIFSLVNPWGSRLYAELQERGIIDRAYEWVLARLETLNVGVGQITTLFEQAWEAMDLTPALDVVERNVAILRRVFTPLIDSVLGFVSEAAAAVLQLIKEALLRVLRELAAVVPGYELLVMILGRDPLTGETVEATTAQIIETFLLLIGAEQELEKMREHGALEETAAWIDARLVEFRALYEEMLALFTQIWDSFSFESLLDPLGTVRSVVQAFAPFAGRVFSFASTVAAKVLEFIKNALLGWLGEYADAVPGFHLLTVILGRNPLTGEAVPRTVENIIRGFMGLIPGGEAQFQQLKETGVIGEVAGRIEALVAELGLTWEAIVVLFTSLWQSLTIADLLEPLAAFGRILARFGEPLGRLFAFVQRVVVVLIEFVLRLMNFPLDLIGQILANAAQAFEDIKNDPIGFLVNLLNAVKEGFTRFFGNILAHLLSGVTGWLFGQLRDAGITPPADLSLGSILQLVLQILGLTAERLWAKLAERIGAERVAQIRGMIDRLTGIWNFVRDVQQRGMAAVWEYIREQIGNLWNMVLEQVRSWIMTRIIEQVVTKLLSMLDPTGIMAVVNSFIAFYRAVQSFIQYLREMLEVVNSFVAGVTDIARGQVAGAAAFLENALARALPIAIGFLANQVGLGRLGEKLQEMIGAVRAMVDRALDWLIDRAVQVGQGLLQMFGLRRDDEEESSGSTEGGGFDIFAIVKSFTEEDGDRHALRFEQIDGRIELIVRSEPMPIAEAISSRRTELSRAEGDNSAKLSALDDAERLKQELDSKSAEYQANLADPRSSVTRSRELGEQIDGLIEQIKGFLATAGIAGELIDLTPSVVSHQESNGRAFHVTARPLTHLPGNTQGTTPRQDPLGWEHIPDSDKGNWVRAHLLNHQLHGPGDDWNLVPGTKETNNNMKTDVENPSKDAVKSVADPKHYFYEATVTYYEGRPPRLYYQYFPRIIVIRWGELIKENGGFREGPDQGRQFFQDPPVFTQVSAAAINESSAARLHEASKGVEDHPRPELEIPFGVFQKLVAVRRELPGQRFQSLEQLIELMNAQYQREDHFRRNYAGNLNVLLQENIIFWDFP